MKPQKQTNKFRDENRALAGGHPIDKTVKPESDKV
jgi:hypothetical protein